MNPEKTPCLLNITKDCSKTCVLYDNSQQYISDLAEDSETQDEAISEIRKELTDEYKRVYETLDQILFFVNHGITLDDCQEYQECYNRQKIMGDWT